MSMSHVPTKHPNSKRCALKDSHYTHIHTHTHANICIHMSLTYLRQDPKKSPIHPQKSPTYLHKSPIKRLNSVRLAINNSQTTPPTPDKTSQKRRVYPQESPIHFTPANGPEKATELSAMGPQRLTFRLTHPRQDLTKEPYKSARKPYISAKEPYISARKPYISEKGPYEAPEFCAMGP